MLDITRPSTGRNAIFGCFCRAVVYSIPPVFTGFYVRFKVRLDGVLDCLFGFIVGVCLCDCCLTKYGVCTSFCYDYYVVEFNGKDTVGKLHLAASLFCLLA